MKRHAALRKRPIRETLTEAYEARAFRDESEAPPAWEPVYQGIQHADPAEFQAVKNAVQGHGEQTILPDDAQFADNELTDLEE